MEKINVRRATPKDIPRILELLVQVDMIHHNVRPDLFKGPATKYSEEDLEEILGMEDADVFVSEDASGFVTGHAFCAHRQVLDDAVLTDVRTLYIDDICVDEDFRGQGVGHALYKYVREYAKAQGFYNITLNVYCCNPGAVKFYESLGLKPMKIGMEEILQD